MGYFGQAAKGVSWVSAFRVSTRTISFARTIILARILTPFDFGIYGIATLVLAFLEILTETGINVVLIQKKDAVDKYINSAWVVSIFRGVLIAILILCLAVPISLFFASPDALGLILFIALVPVIRGFINPSIVKFQKDLKFSSEFRFRFVVFAVDASAALIFSIILQNAYGLLIGLVMGATLEVVLSFLFANPRPKLKFEKEKVGEIINRGKWVTGAGIFQFLFRQGDDIVVGRILGASSLGIYQLAYKISTLPISEVTDVFNRVVFPVYVKISSDRKRLKRAFLKTTGVISLLAIGSGIVIFVLSPLIISLIGEKWNAAIPVLRVLAVFGVIQAINNSGYSLLYALEKNETVIKITFVGILGLGITILPLVQRFGVVGAGMAALVGSLMAFPFMALSLWQIFRR